MYKKSMCGLLLANLLLLAGVFCITGVHSNKYMSKPAVLMKADNSLLADRMTGTVGMIFCASSGQRVVNCEVMEKPAPKEVKDIPEELPVVSMESNMYDLCQEEYDILLRIVEAEAGGEDEEGKLLVANVVLNRVNSDRFPDTISEVVFQQSKGVTQFAPVASGSIWKVTVSEETKKAVERAVNGDDISRGALYFAARKYADSKKMRWFDEELTFLFSHGGHEFYKH